jgi:serine protease Do
MPIEGFGEIAERLRRSTVQISSGRRGQGSGFIFSPDGGIVTNAHVAASNTLEIQLWDGSRTPAELQLRDEGRDLAILRIAKSDLPVAVLADSDRLRVGELVIAIGNPFGFIGALTTGVIHAIGPLGGLGPFRWVQADVQLAPGNSGGPLANALGEVVGVNTMIAGGVGLAVPSNSVSRLLKRRSSPAPLGVVVRGVRIAVNGMARLGLAILEVAKNSAARQASLLVGDIVIGTTDRLFESMEDFEQALDGAGERVVRLQFLRGDRTHVRTVAVRLGVPDLVAA